MKKYAKIIKRPSIKRMDLMSGQKGQGRKLYSIGYWPNSDSSIQNGEAWIENWADREGITIIYDYPDDSQY